MALDLGYLETAWFRQNLILDVGPGAVSEIVNIFPNFRLLPGASYDSTAVTYLLEDRSGGHLQ